jgi:hypothetical protein
MLFPEPATMIRSDQYLGGHGETEERTFPVDPQQGYGRLGLPFLGYTSLEEPCRRPFMLSTGRDILISGWVRRRQPSSVVRPYSAPWSGSSVAATNSSAIKGSRTLSFVHIVCRLLQQSIRFQCRHLDYLAI